MDSMFQLDEAGATSPAPSAAPTHPASTPGSATPPQRGEAADAQDIAVERRVVPLLEFAEDTCSICLEDYTKEDPGAPTVCGHHFHLQCVMQWAQRSRECPLCFRLLQLQDEDMNSLLPFGEYVSPAQRAAEQASLETWELERLLIRLATAGQREHRHRSSRQQGGGGTSRHRRQGSRGEASAPQPIRSGAAGGGGSNGASVAPEAVAAAWWSLPGEGGPTSASHSSSRPPPPPPSAASASAQDLRSASAPSSAFAGSWPPAGGSEASSSGAAGDEGHVVSPRSRSGSLSLKGRLSSLRFKDKLDKTARDLKSLFSPGGGPGGSAGSGSGSDVRRQ